MMYLVSNVNTPTPSFKNTVVQLAIRSPVFHSELIFSDGTWFSSDPESGTRYAKYTLHPYEWIPVALPWITAEDETKIRAWCDTEVGCGYDWKGAILGMLYHKYQDSEKWFCSEICAAALAPYVPTIQKNYWYNPKNLWKVVSDYSMELQTQNM